VGIAHGAHLDVLPKNWNMRPSFRCRLPSGARLKGRRAGAGGRTVIAGARGVHPNGLQPWAVRTLAAVISALALAAPASAQAATQSFSKVMVVMLENQDYEDLIGNPSAPFINSVLEAKHASATRFYANARNSPTAYYAISSGHTYQGGDGGSWAGCLPPTVTCSTTDPSIYEQLTGSGKRWKVYSQGQQVTCQTYNSGKYWTGHNPAIYYQRLGPNSYVSTGDGSCRLYDVPYTQLPADVTNGTVPEFTFLVPDNCSNMHDSCAPYNSPIRQGDAWLQANLEGNATVTGGLINWAQTHDTLLVVTFDEGNGPQSYCCPYSDTGGGGHIGTWVIGPTSKVKSGGYKSSVGYNLFSLFKTMEANWGFTPLGHAADSNVADLSDFFTAGAASPTLSVSSNKGVPGSNTTVSGSGFPPSSGVNLIWDCSSASCTSTKTLGSATADVNGNFTKGVAVPGHADAKWHALGARTAGAFAVRWYQILPKVTLSPTSGATSSAATVTGVGFTANETVNVLWNCKSASCSGTPNLGSATADANGDFSRGVTVPGHVPNAWYAIAGKGTTGTYARGWFNIKPTFVFSPSSGPVGSIAQLTGTGFPSGATITFRWNCTWGACTTWQSLGTATPTSAGDVTRSITIPSGTAGKWYAVGAVNSSGTILAVKWFGVK